MTDDGPTLRFDAEMWAHLRKKGRLPPRIADGWASGTGANLAEDRCLYLVDWNLLVRDDQRALYWALVRAASRGDRQMRLTMAGILHRLGWWALRGTDEEGENPQG